MHKTFVIERFHGEARNQEGRITKMPDRIIGEFGRVGGITPLDGFAHTTSAKNAFNYDWTGVFAGAVNKNDPNSDWFVGYTQTGSTVTSSATSLKNCNDVVYLPGAGLVCLPPRDSLNALYINQYGDAVLLDGPSISVDVAEATLVDGELETNTYVRAVIIYFVPAAHGMIPVASASDYGVITNGNAFAITHYPPSGLPDGTVIGLYIGVMLNQEIIAKWDRVRYVPAEEFQYTFYLKSLNDVSTNSNPVFIGTSIDNGKPGHTTVAVTRSFHTCDSVVVDRPYFYNVIIPGYGYQYSCSRQLVHYSDAGFLGFSDSFTGGEVQFLRFDDSIKSISPSVRGIYAFSDVGTWEAYGSFSSAQDTRVNLVPVLGGIDADDYLITFSGDTAYFVKDGYVHSIGSGGVKAVGKLLDDRLRDALGIFYDRFTRRLYAVYSTGSNRMTIAIYDPTIDGWSELPEFPTGLSDTERRQICLLDNGHILVGDAELVFNQSLPKTDVQLEFKKLDYGEPNTRKATHVIEVPYLGTGVAPTASIAEAGGILQPCNVIDRGGYYEIRCPTVVARAFDFHMRVWATDDDFAINPPLVFTYRQYGRTPDQK